MGNPLSLIYGQGVLLSRMYSTPSLTLRKWGVDKFKVAVLGCGLVNWSEKEGVFCLWVSSWGWAKIRGELVCDCARVMLYIGL